MHLEVEQKFRVASLDAVRRGLIELGAKLAEPIEQADTYFSHPARNFAQTDEALRLRRVGDANCITYKGPKLDLQTKTRRELELPLAPGQESYDHFSELLLALGFGQVATVHKRREIAHARWQDFNVEIALDEVPTVGEFVELEISAEPANLAAAKACLHSLAGQLGLQNSERRSYLEMLLAKSS